MDLLLVFACFYMAYQLGSGLIQQPIYEWELVHWVMAVVTVLLVSVAVFKCVNLYKEWKYKKEHPEEFEEEEKAKEAKKPKKPVTYIQEYEDDYKAWADDDPADTGAANEEDSAAAPQGKDGAEPPAAEDAGAEEDGQEGGKKDAEEK